MLNAKVYKTPGNNWKIYLGKCTTRYDKRSSLFTTHNYFYFMQVSETENLRKNLALERMIVEGCDILLDVNQVFVRQGTT